MKSKNNGYAKRTLMIALLVASATMAIAPTSALAKKGDLYVNSDGSCDKGDTKKGYWCIESIAVSPRAESTAKTPTSKGTDAPKPTRIYPSTANCKAEGGIWAGEDGKGSCTEPRKK